MRLSDLTHTLTMIETHLLFVWYCLSQQNVREKCFGIFLYVIYNKQMFFYAFETWIGFILLAREALAINVTIIIWSCLPLNLTRWAALVAAGVASEFKYKVLLTHTHTHAFRWHTNDTHTCAQISHSHSHAHIDTYFVHSQRNSITFCSLSLRTSMKIVLLIPSAIQKQQMPLLAAGPYIYSL